MHKCLGFLYPLDEWALLSLKNELLCLQPATAALGLGLIIPCYEARPFGVFYSTTYRLHSYLQTIRGLHSAWWQWASLQALCELQMLFSLILLSGSLPALEASSHAWDDEPGTKYSRAPSADPCAAPSSPTLFRECHSSRLSLGS